MTPWISTNALLAKWAHEEMAEKCQRYAIANEVTYLKRLAQVFKSGK